MKDYLANHTTVRKIGSQPLPSQPKGKSAILVASSRERVEGTHTKIIHFIT